MIDAQLRRDKEYVRTAAKRTMAPKKLVADRFYSPFLELCPMVDHAAFSDWSVPQRRAQREIPERANVLNSLRIAKPLLPSGLARRASTWLRPRTSFATALGDGDLQPADLAGCLSGSRHTHLAFDIFDTLVVRTVAPEHVKALAADRLSRMLGSEIDGRVLFQARQEAERSLCQRNFSQCRELEFRFAELADEIPERLAARGIALSDETRHHLRLLMLDCELAVERSVLRPIGPALDALALARKLGKTIVLVSDFYLTKQSVIELLEPFVTMSPSDAVFVSSDLMASKRSGRLYPAVCAELGISPSDLLMVGDNVHSDYAQARANGIDAVLVREPAHVAFYQSPAASAFANRTALAALRGVLKQSPLPDSHNLRAVVPSLYLFIEQLYAVARRGGFRDLCFLAREGQPLRSMFDSYQDTLGCRGPERIRTHYLLVSRRSCYGPSLGPLQTETFDGLFRYYRRMSIRDFLQSLGFAEDRVALLNAQIKADFDDPLDDFPASDALRALRKSGLFQKAYDEHRLAQRAHLLAYINSLGIPLDRHPLVLVDIGWKGSIQDYLTLALGKKVELQGYYFGLLNAGQPLENKSGLVFTNAPHLSPSYRTYNENRTVFELLLCADHGSALRYEAREDGDTDVVLDHDEDELNYIHDELLPLRDDMLAAFREFCDVRNRYCLTQDEIAAFAVQAHAELVFRPWCASAQTLASARHRENFGAYTTSRYVQRGRSGLRDKLHFCRDLIRRPRTALLGSFWPALTLLQHTNRLLACAYGAARRAQDYRTARSATANRLGGGG